MNAVNSTKPNSSRLIVVLILGLVLGGAATYMGVRVYQSHQDKFPGGLMQVIAHQSEKLKNSQESSRCTATDVEPRIQSMRILANDLEDAFPGLRDDARFKKDASNFRATLNDALATPPVNCTALGKVTGEIAKDCRACHQDFR